MDREEYEINLIDLIFYLLGKWKSLIVLLVVTAALVVGGRTAYTLAAHSSSGDGSASDEYEPTQLALTYMDTAYALHNEIAELKAYASGSAALNLNPDETYYGKLSLRVEGNGPESEYLVQQITDLRYDGDTLERLIAASGADMDVQDLAALISASSSVMDGTNPELAAAASAVAYTEAPEQEADTGGETVSGGATAGIPGEDEETDEAFYVVTYGIYLDDSDALSAMLKELGAIVEETGRESAGPGSVAVDSTYVSSWVRTASIDDKYSLLISKIYTVVNDYGTMIGKLSDDDLEYFEEVYLSGKADEAAAGAGEAAGETAGEAAGETAGEAAGETAGEAAGETAGAGIEDGSSGVNISKKSTIKYAIVGLLLGFVIWGAIGVVRYIMDGRIRYAAELEESFGVKIIGRVMPAGHALCRLGELHEKSVNASVPGFTDVGEIARCLELRPEPEFYLTGNAGDADIVALKDSLVAAGTKAKAEHFGFIDQESEALSAAKEAGTVIVIAKVGETGRYELTRVAQAAAQYGISVAGAVTIG